MDITAPGGLFEVTSAESGSTGAATIGKYQWFGGTSAAGPHVAGVAALVLQKNPSFTPTQVIGVLRTTAFTDTYTEQPSATPNDHWGWGKLNAAGAVQNTPAPVADFTLIVTPTWRQVTAGASAHFAVGMQPVFGFTAPVTLSLRGLPAASLGAWSQQTISPGVTSNLSITTTWTTPPGDHRPVITGRGGGLTRTVEPALTVLAPALAVSRSVSLNAVAGAAVTYTIHVTNTGNVTATAVVITDRLPADAFYISGGNSFTGTIIQWTGLTVRTGAAAHASFVVSTCESSLLNQRYRVATSAQGVTSTWGTPFHTAVGPPTIDASFDHSPSTIDPGETVYFTDTTTWNGRPIDGWTWEFGDGDTGSGATTSHTYNTDGPFTVTLRVTDTCGYTASVTLPDAVATCVSLTGAGIRYIPSRVVAGETVTFTAVLTPGDAGQPVNVTWSFVGPTAAQSSNQGCRRLTSSRRRGSTPRQ